MELFLEVIEYGQEIKAPLETFIVLFVLKCVRRRGKDSLNLVRVVKNEASFHIPRNVMDECIVLTKKELSDEVKNCVLPAICVEKKLHFITGLCAVLRRILKDEANDLSKKLLGFRGACLAACAEVSVWTKFCEIDVVNSTKYVHSNANNMEPSVCIDLMRLESHLQQPVRVHNISKRRQHLAKTLARGTNSMQMTESNIKDFNYKNDGENADDQDIDPIQNYSQDDESDIRERTLQRKFEALETSANSDAKVEQLIREMSLKMKLEEKTLLSKGALPQLSHTYVEGADLTLADIILFPCIHQILVLMAKKWKELNIHIPLVFKWYNRMKSDENVFYAMTELKLADHLYFNDQTAVACVNFNDTCAIDSSDGFNSLVLTGSQMSNKKRNEHQNILTNKVSLSHSESKCSSFTRQREIDDILLKTQAANIEVVYSSHPCSNVALDWTALPDIVHPSYGELPNSRILRKCQQVENLVNVVLQIAKQSDVIVDFCSGGGHLGIVLAYLLPRCQVIMIDNKEESLIRAKDRVVALGLTNAVLYQSNLDYFIGRFDIGTSLHACGVATDLVLNRCLKENAAFVVCPCCYGAVKDNHIITYPRSDIFKQAGINYREYLILGHSSDQTHFNDPKSGQGKQCMGLIDMDRLLQTIEFSYSSILCSLVPITCTPKNNLLIGLPPVVFKK